SFLSGVTPMKTRWMVLSLSAAMLVAVGGLQGARDEARKHDAKEKKFAPTCPVSGKPAGEDHVLELKNGNKVYFCCDNCPETFKGDRKKFELQVKRQLVENGPQV